MRPFAEPSAAAKPVAALTAAQLDGWIARQSARDAAWVRANGFRADTAKILTLPGDDGQISGAVLGLGSGDDPLAIAALAHLPEGDWQLTEWPQTIGPERVAVAYLLGAYAFRRYRGEAGKEGGRLVPPSGADLRAAQRIAEGVYLARDLINTPASDMGPDALAAAGEAVAARFGAQTRTIVGADLLAANFPMVHAVGRAAARPPRLFDMMWGDPGHPKVTLVGKGVCFDSGGLDIKPASAMLTMKKDMGGAACVLGLAHMIMDAALPVRLRVLAPAVENSISGEAYRPGDVLTSRKGLTVEIGNTDAEGRLVLADALAEADLENPELLVDIATLTGAARTATGFELPPYFTDDETLAADLMRHATAEADYMWRLPLWRGYESWIQGKVADLTNSPDSGLAGAITAALFLKRFVSPRRRWVHFDIAAWTDKPKPGRPAGAEAHVIRALFALLRERYAP